MIIKSFRKKGFGCFGQNIKSWTDTWNEVEGLVASARNAEKDFLSLFFKKYFQFPPSKILEGGCGTGKYVIAYRKMGYDIVGVDFSGDTVRRIKKELGHNFPVYEADITALPFGDDHFDCYYSGGVIEHFEEGPDIALREARRVIKKGGVLLAAVPYINILRKLYYSIFLKMERKNFLQKKVKMCQCNLDTPEGYNFCEYVFDINSLVPYFKNNGFLIEKTCPANFLWGEIGFMLRKFINKGHNIAKVKTTGETVDNAIRIANKKSLIKDLIYDFLITENRDNMFFGLPITFLNYLSGNTILFVARAI